MANFIALIDPDAARRETFLAAVRPELPLLANLVTESLAVGDFAAAWACSPRSPRQQLVNAGWFLQRHQAADAELSADGFFAALAFDPHQGLAAIVDHLGLYPLCFWSNHEVVIVAASPHLIRRHPLVSTRLDPHGLVGDRTLLANIRRLRPQHRLLWRPGAAARQVPDAPFRGTTRLHDPTYADQLDLLDTTLAGTVARLVPEGHEASLLLSGGLDSRLVSGYLAQQGRRPQAITFGRPTDHEVRFGRRIAATLGLAFRNTEVDLSQFAAMAEQEVRWGQLANGFAGFECWGFAPILAQGPPWVQSAFVFDTLLGGTGRWRRMACGPSTCCTAPASTLAVPCSASAAAPGPACRPWTATCCACVWTCPWPARCIGASSPTSSADDSPNWQPSAWTGPRTTPGPCSRACAGDWPTIGACSRYGGVAPGPAPIVTLGCTTSTCPSSSRFGVWRNRPAGDCTSWRTARPSTPSCRRPISRWRSPTPSPRPTPPSCCWAWVCSWTGISDPRHPPGSVE